MSARDDINSLYNASNNYATLNSYLFIANLIASIVSIFLMGTAQEVLLCIQIIFAVVYIMVELIDDGILWFRAERARRKNSMQNAFATRFSELDTDGYYNNSLNPSLMKYALNQFESNFFTKNISEKMLAKSILKSVLAVIVLIIAARYVHNGDIILVITQTVFSATVVEDTVRLVIYVFRMKKIYDEAYTEFITVGITRESQKVWLLSYSTEYEAIKSYYKIRLDSKIFRKMNPELSVQWESLKESIQCNNND